MPYIPRMRKKVKPQNSDSQGSVGDQGQGELSGSSPFLQPPKLPSPGRRPSNMDPRYRIPELDEETDPPQRYELSPDAPHHELPPDTSRRSELPSSSTGDFFGRHPSHPNPQTRFYELSGVTASLQPYEFAANNSRVSTDRRTSSVSFNTISSGYSNQPATPPTREVEPATYMTNGSRENVQDYGSSLESHGNFDPRYQELIPSPLSQTGPPDKQNMMPPPTPLGLVRAQTWDHSNREQYSQSKPIDSYFSARQPAVDKDAEVSTETTRHSADWFPMQNDAFNYPMGSNSEIEARSGDDRNPLDGTSQGMNNEYFSANNSSGGYRNTWSPHRTIDRRYTLEGIQFSRTTVEESSDNFSDPPPLRQRTRSEYGPRRQASLKASSYSPQNEPFECLVKICETTPLHRDQRPLTLKKLMTFDTGCRGGNWVRQDVIDELQATPWKLAEQEEFVDFNGRVLIASEKIEISFREDGEPPFTAWFLVADYEAPFSIVLGGEDCRHLGILPEPNLRYRDDRPRLAWGLVARRNNQADRERQAQAYAEQKARHEKHERERKQKMAQGEQGNHGQRRRWEAGARVYGNERG